MILKYLKTTIVKNREWEDELADAYEFKIIWEDTEFMYWEVFWDTDLFISDNPEVYEIQYLPVKLKTFISDKFNNINSYNDLLKWKTRERIEKEVWDVYDLVADMDKRLWMVERMWMRLADVFINWRDPGTDSFMQWYKPFVEQYITLVNSWQIVWRNDLEDLTVIFWDLVSKINTISTIVKTEYLDKK